MKNFQHTKLKALFFIVVSFLMAACINEIKDEDTLTPGTIPIQISSEITQEQVGLSGNKFQTNDEIGLYIVRQDYSLEGERYIDNMRFTCKNGVFEPDLAIYYPNEKGIYDFTSYYPYQNPAILPEKSLANVSVKSNQNLISDYRISDFMVARTLGISPTAKNINLLHKHQFAQINFILQLTENDDLNEVKENASITLENLFTKATYDFSTQIFSTLNTPDNMYPNGDWTIDLSSRTLAGKSVLIVPQTLGNCRVTLRVNGREFSKILPSDLNATSGVSSKLTLRYNAEVGLEAISCSIDEWKDGGNQDIELEEDKKKKSLSIANLDFKSTGVYTVLNSSNNILAEITKEYLLSDNIAAQAIVLYPAGSRENGIVLQLLNTSEPVHRGEVVWSIANNSLTYTTGILPAVTTIYATESGEIVFSEPTNAQTISSQKQLLTDTRNGNTTTYPIVKIGTQYWMQSELKATQYRDGTPINLITDKTSEEAGYHTQENNNFYNNAALIGGELAPQGWCIPTQQSWKSLEAYIGNNTALLKAGSEWIAAENINAATNLTGFNGYPIGFFSKKINAQETIFDFKNSYACYWYIDKELANATMKGFSLKYNSNAIDISDRVEYYSYAIRCVKQ